MDGQVAPHTLLAKALASLPEDEQGEVLKSLLPVPAFGGHNPGWVSEATAATAAMALGFQQDVVAHTTRVSGGSQASLLVRLPAPLHAQLKAWSESNGYSMNTVVTGLLERFLRSQPPQSADG